MPSGNSQPRNSLGRQQHSSEASQSTTAKAAERLAELVSATNKQDLQVLAVEFIKSNPASTNNLFPSLTIMLVYSLPSEPSFINGTNFVE